MDISNVLANAGVLALVVFGLIELAKKFYPSKLSTDVSSKLTVGLVVVVSFAAVFLVAASQYGHTQIINGRSLDNMDIYTKVVSSILIAVFAVTFNKTLGAVADIGVPKPSKAQQAALDNGAAALNAKLQHPGGTTTPDVPADIPPSTMPPAP